ncbi:MAG: aminopeptidase P family protein [Hyphomicrobiaceae bacterium]
MFQTFDETAATEEVAGRVAGLRDKMRSERLDAFLVPRGDEHRGEYVAPASERLKWLTAFSGSAGLAAVGLKSAALFVDGRYTVQAPQQTDTSVFDVLQAPAAKASDWLIKSLKSGDVVGFDGWLHSIQEIEQLSETLKPHGIKLKPLARQNPIDQIWGASRPPPPANPVTVHAQSRAGQSAVDKMAQIQKALVEAGQDAVLLTMPDSICWLFNIRGSDIPHTPVVLAFAIVPKRGKAELFIAPGRLDDAVRAHLKPVAKLVDPAKLKNRLAALKSAGKTLRLSTATGAFWFQSKLGKKLIVPGADPCLKLKAIKNPAEIKGMRSAHQRDAVAVCRFLAWFDREAAVGKLDEITAARQLETFRRETNKLKEISFDTISGSGPHGAIVHYRVNVETNRVIGRNELFLVDSGGQYEDGTTDITRTIATGKPSADMRKHFTLVLKGHIAIAMARFPVGTRGLDLDPLARVALWQHGLDFDHGTGHGVGSYLSVHEGPQSISKRGDVELEPGMIISNEPGFYKEGAYGIRIENLVLVEPATRLKGGDRDMLSFETLTFAPIDRRLIETELLSDAERAWLDAYHAQVFETVAGKLDTVDTEWLRDATQPLG